MEDGALHRRLRDGYTTEQCSDAYDREEKMDTSTFLNCLIISMVYALVCIFIATFTETRTRYVDTFLPIYFGGIIPVGLLLVYGGVRWFIPHGYAFIRDVYLF